MPRKRVALAGEPRSTTHDTGDSDSSLRYLLIDSIDTSNRVRRFYNSIGDLAASLDEHGLLQPIVVREVGVAQYRLVAGGRRLQAARMLLWRTVLARVIAASDKDGRLLELIENMQREDLTPDEEAEALEELMLDRGWSVRQVAEAIKRSASFVSKRVRVFEDPALREAVLGNGLSISTAEELLAVPSEARAELLALARAEKWDQATARAAVKRGPAANPAPRKGRVTAPFRTETLADLPNTRPRGLTQQIKALRTNLQSIKPWDLTTADRRELRGLYNELHLLGRAPVEKRQPIFPPLPH